MQQLFLWYFLFVANYLQTTDEEISKSLSDEELLKDVEDSDDLV